MNTNLSKQRFSLFVIIKEIHAAVFLLFKTLGSSGCKHSLDVEPVVVYLSYASDAHTIHLFCNYLEKNKK